MPQDMRIGPIRLPQPKPILHNGRTKLQGRQRHQGRQALYIRCR